MVKKAYILDFSFQGYKHIKAGIPNQDYSSSYSGKDFFIIGVADGHSSSLYFRSNLGSRYAILAAFEELQKLNQENEFNSKTAEQFKIRLLSKWHKLIDDDIARNPFKSEETSKLSDKDFAKLKENQSFAYGTTLTCALINKEMSFVFTIGDSNAMYYDKQIKAKQLFTSEDENESNTNLTDSICEEDAYFKIKHAFLSTSDLSSIVLSTDGALNPYQKFEDYQYYVPLMFLKEKFLKKNQLSELMLEEFIKQLAEAKGTGDDVSFAIYFKDNLNLDHLDTYSNEEILGIINEIEFKKVSKEWIVSKYERLSTEAKRKLYYFLKKKSFVWEDKAKEVKFLDLVSAGIDPISSMIIVERDNL